MTTRTLVELVMLRIRNLFGRGVFDSIEMTDAKSAWQELLDTHPKITRAEIAIAGGAYKDILIWCPGRPAPFSVKEMLEEKSGVFTPGPIRAEFMKLSGYAELHDLDSLLDPKF